MQASVVVELSQIFYGSANAQLFFYDEFKVIHAVEVQCIKDELSISLLSVCIKKKEQHKQCGFENNQ